jgi:ferredoxin
MPCAPGGELFARELPFLFSASVGCAAPVISPDRRSIEATRRKGDTDMKVWIDQDLCTGDGLCEEIAPDVFALLDDGLAYVKDGDKVLSEPGGAEAVAPVPAGQEEAVIESAEECPGECIFIEV